MNKRLFRSAAPLAPVCMVAAGILTISPNLAQAQALKGKTISIMVGYSAGGGTDAAARLIAEHLGKHVPGNPKFIVRNMPGGGGVRAHNYVFEKAKPDGQMLIYAPSALQGQLLKRPGIRFDYSKFAIIAPFKTAPSVIYGRTDIVPGGLKSSSDITKAPKLVFAGLRPTSSLSIWSVASLNLLGVKYRFVSGYRGTAKMVKAVTAGEANISATSLQGIRSTVEPTLIKKGAGKLLWYFPVKDDDGNWVKSANTGAIPTFLEVYKQVHGKDPSGPEWERFNYWADVFSLATTFLMGPPGMDKAATSDLRNGVAKMITDKDYIAAQKKLFGFAARLADATKVSARMNKIIATDSPHLAYWKKTLGGLGKKK